ncbi:unnamed protein product, partial [Effrenium voratum]
MQMSFPAQRSVQRVEWEEDEDCPSMLPREPEEIETDEAVWSRREAARMRQIAIGKARPEYRRYREEVPVEERQLNHPSTPNPQDRVSKRQFDRHLGEWRRKLHEFDAEHGFGSENERLSGEGPVQPGAMAVPRSDTRSSFPGVAPLPRNAPPPPRSPPRPELQVPETAGILQLRLADTLPVPLAAAAATPMSAAMAAPAQVPELSHGEYQVDLASAAAIGIAAAYATLMKAGLPQMQPMQQMPSMPSMLMPQMQQMPQMPQMQPVAMQAWSCEMPCESMMFVPAHHMEASSGFVPVVPGPETPLRPQKLPMADGETPPPPFTMQEAAPEFVPSGCGLGALSEECEKVEKGTMLTFEDEKRVQQDFEKSVEDEMLDMMSPCKTKSRNRLGLPQDAMSPSLVTPPRARAAPCSPQAQTPCLGGWATETPSPMYSMRLAVKPAKPMADFGPLATSAKGLKGRHLRELLKDEARCDAMMVEAEGICLDYCRQKVDQDAMKQLFDLAKAAGVEQKKKGLFAGEKINETEGRAVLHVALRAPKEESIQVDGKNVVPEVHQVLDSIKAFSEKVRSGGFVGYTGKPLTDVLCIGIGGSYLAVEFVHEALRTDPTGAASSKGRQLRFLANVDPIDVKRALAGLKAETTLVIVISKTFTTAETMLNARTVKSWLVKELGSEQAIAKHVAACSTALDKTKAFGIDSENVFGFWDWVGGRFSVCSAVGVVPLSLQYGFEVVQKFLSGARAMDVHFQT